MSATIMPAPVTVTPAPRPAEWRRRDAHAEFLKQHPEYLRPVPPPVGDALRAFEDSQHGELDDEPEHQFVGIAYQPARHEVKVSAADIVTARQVVAVLMRRTFGFQPFSYVVRPA